MARGIQVRACIAVTPLQMPGMVNVVNKCCEHEGCVKRPSFNFPNVRPARFCGQVHVALPLHYALSFVCAAHATWQHRVAGMVSTTIGYRCKQQEGRQNKRHGASCNIDCGDELASSSPSHGQSSDNSAETVYRPCVQPCNAAGPSMQIGTASSTIAAPTLLPVDLAMHRSIVKESIAGGGHGVTPATITKRRRRFSEPNRLEISTFYDPSPLLKRQPSDVPTVSKTRMPCRGSSISQEGQLHVKTSPSAVPSSGVFKKPAHSSLLFGKEHKGAEVSQRVINACTSAAPRISRLFGNCINIELPVGHRTPVKTVRAIQPVHCDSSVSRVDDSDLELFSGNSDSEDCFSDHEHAPNTLLDAFSPVRPSSQFSTSETHDFELEFGWDPVVRNAVIRNAFNGFGAIRSH